MKKVLSIIILALCLSLSVFANNGNIWLEFRDKMFSVEQVINKLQTEFDLPDGSELLLSRSVEDNIGMTHYTYQQFVDGVKIEGCYMLIHVRDNKVSSVNGRLLEAENLPHERSFIARKQLRSRNIITDSESLEPLIFEYQGSYRSVYKYYDAERFANVYFDAKTGEEIFSESVIAYEDVPGTVSTIYNGSKTVTCNHNSGSYILLDSARNIYTVDASNYNGSNDNTLDNFTSTSTTRNNAILSSVTIEWSAQDWWYNSLTDTKPDFYIQISKGGTILYESGFYDDANPPVTFNIPVLIETDGNLKIEILDYDGVSDDSAGKVSISKTSAGTYSWNNSKTRASYTLINNPAHDVHWGMEQVYDFYFDKFGRKSYNGNGSQIFNLVNPRSSFFENAGFPHNACAIGNTGIMAYGIGDRENTNPWVTIDVIGHEFTHMVTATNGSQNLPNYGEGGALNESFGDILGNAIEAYALGNTDWLFAKGVKLKTANNACRSLNDPKSMQTPSTYLIDEYWKTITGQPNDSNDQDWVHFNCGVQNFWFYLLCQGGSGYINDDTSNESYSVVGIGMDKAVQIVYRNLLTYITSTSKYPDSRNGSIQAAIDLYGIDSQEHQSVMNAWHAVGVGERYVAPSEEFKLNPGNYVIVANRNKDTDKNWYYMTSDLGTASTKRLQAVSTGTESMDAIVTSNLENKYIWTLEADGDYWKLKNGTKYVTWTSGNSATLGSTAKSLTFEIEENKVQAHFNDGTNERYLSLNAAVNNNYFAFYANTLQITDLYFLPYDEGTTPPPTPECKKVPYVETFSSSQGDFIVENPLLPDGFASIWNWDSQYGMVAKATKNQTKYESESWLLSPCIELPEEEKCVLTFSHAAKFFSDTKQMSLWFTTNYITDDPGASDWEQLTIPTYPTGNNWDWFESGEIDLSAYAGEHVVFGFQYTSTTSSAPQWEIKNFTVSPKTTTSVDNAHDNKPSASKILRDGQILILRGDKTYTLTGQQVK